MKSLTNKQCYDLMMKVKGEIDTIRELKNIEDSNHPLTIASDALNDYLDALEEQLKMNRNK